MIIINTLAKFAALAFVVITTTVIVRQTEANSATGEIPEKDELIEQLKHWDAPLRITAVYNIAKLEDSSVTPDLTTALKDKNCAVRGGAAYALGVTAEQSSNPETISALKNALDDKINKVRLNAAITLLKMKTAEDRSKQTLSELLTDSDKYVRLDATRALHQTGTSKYLRKGLTERSLGY